MFMCPLYIILEMLLFRFFAQFLIGLFVFLEWSGVNSVYILETKPLSKVSLANVFSNSVGSFFMLLMFPLAMQKLFILMKSHLFILSFTSLSVGDILVIIILYQDIFRYKNTYYCLKYSLQ